MLLLLLTWRHSLRTDCRHRHARTAGTSYDGLLAVHVLQWWTRNGTGHNLARYSLRWLMQMRWHPLALLNRQLLRLWLLLLLLLLTTHSRSSGRTNVVQLGQADGLILLVHLRRLLRKHLAADGRSHGLDQLLLADQMNRLHVS